LIDNGENFLKENEKVSLRKIVINKNELALSEKALKDAMTNHPLETATYFFEHNLNKANSQPIFSLPKIEKLLTKTRSELFPKQPEIIFGGKIIQ